METNWIQVITGIIGGGGLLGMISTFIITRRRAENMSVKTAEGALVVQERIVTNLTSELKRMKEDCDEVKIFNAILLDRLRELGGNTGKTP